jgi:hypothetical protein
LGPNNYLGELKPFLKSARNIGKPDKPLVSEILKIRKEFLDHLEDIRSPAGYPLPQVLLSIGVLIHTLSTLYEVDDVEEIQENNAITLSNAPNKDRMGISAKWLMEDMVNRGWCPSKARRVCSLPYGSAYYLSRMSPSTRNDKEHEYCTIHSCIAYNIATGEYKIRHESNCVDEKICMDNRGTVPEEAAEIIRRGKLPLFWAEKREDGSRISLRVKEMELNDQYIAISHVWSDGRGNETENSLPQCQLHRLADYVSRTPRGIGWNYFVYPLIASTESLKPINLFWIDTLGIPLNKKLRKDAIDMIPAVYAGAASALILDKGMEEAYLGGSEWPELSGKLLFSAWSGRCWTLEEASFSGDSFVRVANGYFRPMSLGYKGIFGELATSPVSGKLLWKLVGSHIRQFAKDLLHPDPDRRLGRQFERTMIRMLSEPIANETTKMFLRSEEQSTEYDPIWTSRRKLVNTWNSLVPRQTSKEEDKLTIFVHLLGLSPTDVNLGGRGTASQQCEQDQNALTMKRILMAFDHLPIDLLFHDGPRLRPDQDQKFRWLPLCTTKESIKSTENDMFWGKEGLKVRRDKYGTKGPQTYLMMADDKTRGADRVILNFGRFLGEREQGRYDCKWMLQFLRKPNDRLDRSRYHFAAIVCHQLNDFEDVRGAYVLISKIYQPCFCPINGPFPVAVEHSPDCKQELTVESTYDCPVRIRYTCHGPDYRHSVEGEDDNDSSGINQVYPLYLRRWLLTVQCG